MHTKGPWVSRKTSGDHYTKVLYHITPDFNEHLIIAKAPASNECDQANARLIAAAPELLEALELVASRFPYGGGDLWIDTRARITEAIRKAKGV